MFLMHTLKEETFAVSRFLAKSAKVYSGKFFKSRHPRKFLPAKFSKKAVICECSEKNTLLYSRYLRTGDFFTGPPA